MERLNYMGMEGERSGNHDTVGVSNCYVFKSRLQEYAQKAGIATPVYETIKEGPPHAPSFSSTVIVNNVRYDSLPGFSTRKAAEQSAAEVALMELSHNGDKKECISQPVHETGLCKNLLQEYSQKMNYAIPLYECQKDDKQGRAASFSCTVDIGGTKYIGTAASTKKEAELKAARTALLAIQSTASWTIGRPTENSQYTVIPTKKVPDLGINIQETAAALKSKKRRLKKKYQKKKRVAKKRAGKDAGNDFQPGGGPGVTAAVCNQGTEAGLLLNDATMKLQDERSSPGQVETNFNDENASATLGADTNKTFKDGHVATPTTDQNGFGTANPDANCLNNCSSSNSLANEVKEIPGTGQEISTQ